MPSKKRKPDSQSEPAPQSVIDTPPLPERKTKVALLLELVSRERGATLNELTAATGWLPHTVRAAITGLRKRGHDVQRQLVDGISSYTAGRHSG